MNFFKKNEKAILILIVIGLMGITGLRMGVSLTLEPGEEPTGVAAMLGIEPTPEAGRGAMAPKQLEWSFEGYTGTYDRKSVWRGLQVYREVCSACHSLDLVAFRMLPEIMVGRDPDREDLARAEEAAKAIAASYQIDTIDDFGDPATRPGRLEDHFPAPFANEQAAKAANGGRMPPDLSLMPKARMDGPNYVYSLLTGYQDPPADFEPLSNTTVYNPYFEGWEIGMAPPLYDGAVEYEDGTEATVDQMARDVVNFLMWSAEPKLEDRHEMGFKVVIYSLVMTLFFFFSMKTIWRRIKK